MVNKLKVLHIITSFNRAGAESVIINLCNGMDAELFDISILSLKNEIAANKKLRKEIPIYVLGKLPIEIINNIPFVRLNYFLKLRKIIKQINPDIIHGHLLEGIHSLILPYLASKCNAKFVVTLHTKTDHYAGLNLKDLISKSIESFSLNNVHAKIVTVSYDMFKYIKSNVHFKDIITIQNCLDSKYYDRKANFIKINKLNYNIHNDDFLIIHLGRLSSVKNQDMIIRAMPYVLSSYSNIKLLLIGQRGGSENYYKKIVANLNLEDKVLFLGEFDDVRPFLAVADLGVFPSRREGISLALLEMMSMELPVIVSDIPEFKEVFDETDFNDYVKIDDHQSLAKNIIKLILNKNSRSALGKMLKAQVENKFDINIQVNNYAKIYNELIKTNME